jgi:DNA-directed RNA polymerase II subunit RPB1
MTVYLQPYEEDDKERAALYATMMQYTKLGDVVKHVQICFDPDESNTNLLEDRLLLEQFYEFERTLQECLDAEETAAAAKRSKWIVRMEFASETLLERGLTMDDIHQAIAQSQYGPDAHCVFSDYNMDNLVFRIRMNGSVFNKNKKKVPEPLDQSDEIYLLKNFQDQLLKNVVLRGVSGVRNVQVRKVQNQVAKSEGTFVPKEPWCLDTTGSNLIATLGLPYVDTVRTYTNDIREIFHVLGIEAARQSILNELNEVMEFSGGVYINYHHTSLLCDRMTCNKDMVSIFRSGLLNDDTGPIAKASFEVHTEVLLDAARHADVDHMRGVSASIMCGQYGSYGTGAFNLVLDTKAMEKLPSARVGSSATELEAEKTFMDGTTTCRKDVMEIKTHLPDAPTAAVAVCDDAYDAGF